MSHLGVTTRYLYDSRDNVVQISDGMGVVGSTELDSLDPGSEHGTFRGS